MKVRVKKQISDETVRTFIKHMKEHKKNGVTSLRVVSAGKETGMEIMPDFFLTDGHGGGGTVKYARDKWEWIIQGRKHPVILVPAK